MKYFSFLFFALSAFASPASQEIITIDEGIVSLMTIEGEASPCARIAVKPPKATMWSDTLPLESITLIPDSCSGAEPQKEDSWDYSKNDSWKNRKPLIVAKAKGGYFSCSIGWSYSGLTEGPVQFSAEWFFIVPYSCQSALAKI